MDKVKFPLKSPYIFLHNDGALNNIEQCVPMKDADLFFADQYVSFEDAMSFLETLSTILKIPEELNNDTNESHSKNNCLLLYII